MSMRQSRIPRYNASLFLFIPFLLYLTLNLSLLSTVFVEDVVAYVAQFSPEIKAFIESEGEAVEEMDQYDVYDSDDEDDGFAGIYLITFLGTSLLVQLFNLPIKIFFRRKRKGREISPFILNYTRRCINFSPEIITFIVLLGALFLHDNMRDYMNSLPRKEFLYSALRNIYIISSFTTVLVLLLIYLGQKFRVQTKYIDHVYDSEELKKTPLGLNFPGMRGRFFITTIFVSLIPLIIVIFFVFFSIESVNLFKTMTNVEFKLLFGQWIDIIQIFTDQDPKQLILGELDIERVYFISNFGIAQLVFGIIPGLLCTFLFILLVVHWSNSSILKPVNELILAMKKVQNGDLDAYTTVRSREETGLLSAGFNEMLDGLKDRDKIKSLFGQYLSAEISEEILRGNVDLDGSIYEATILIADIRGFTTLSESITPHETISFLNEYYNVMIDVIHRHGGIIDKFLGDGIMVLFGVPVSSKDHADRAISAAFEMREKLAIFNERRKSEGLFTIDIGIGIHSGEVVAGNVGNADKLEYTVIGDTVNVASRIEALTKKFETGLLIGESVYNNLSTQSEFKLSFEKIDGVTLRGKRAKINLLKLIS